MRIIVQKFGGSSVATPEARRRVAERVVTAIEEGYAPVVVVSAMGRAGDPYATDTLIDMARAGGGGVTARDLDLLMACGEIMSAVVLAGIIRGMGHDAIALTGGQAGLLTDDSFGDARIIRVETDRLLLLLREGKIAVVAGFQGVTEAGEVTTLGRGGSDTTAAALGAALRADVVDIYTDVDGVKTADPRLVPEARTLQVITYDEVAQMAHEGARVIHPRAVEIARRNNVPLRIRSTFDEAPGTLVTYGFDASQQSPSLFDGRVVTGVTHIPSMARITIRTAGEGDESGEELRVFSSLARAGISVDLINVFPGSKVFCVKENVSGQAEEILREEGFRPEVIHGCAKVSVVGTGMRGVPGVMAGVVAALHRAGVRILQTADSHVTISCLVREEDLPRAVQALHDQFGLGSAGGLGR